MATIPRQYSEQGLGGGATASPVSADIFGTKYEMQDARKLQEGLGNVQDFIEKRQLEDESMWVDNAVTQSRLYLSNRMTEMQNQAGEGAPNFTPAAMEEFAKYSKTQIEAAPSRRSQMAMSKAFNDLGVSWQGQAMGFEAKERVGKIANDLDRNIGSTSSLLMKNKGATFEDDYGRLEGSIENMKDRLTPDLERKLKNGLETLGLVTLESIGDENPSEAVKQIDAGRYTNKVDPYKLVNLRKQFQNQADRQDAMAASKTKSLQDDIFDQVSDTGIVPQQLIDKLPVKVSGSEEFSKQMQISKSTFAINDSIRNTPTSELGKVLEKTKPIVVGGISEEKQKAIDDFIRENPSEPLPPEIDVTTQIVTGTDEAGAPVYEDVLFGYSTQDKLHKYSQKAVDEEIKLRNENPFGASTRAPEVSKAQKHLNDLKDQKSPFHSNNPMDIALARLELIEKSVNWQKQMGIISTSVMSADEAEGQALSINSAKDSQQLQQTLGSMESEFGKHFGSALSAMTSLPKKNKISPIIGIAASQYGKPFFNTVANAAFADDKAMDQGLKARGVKEEDFLTASESDADLLALQDVLNALPKADKVEAFEGHRNSAIHIAKYISYTQKGMDATSSMSEVMKNTMDMDFGTYNNRSYTIKKNRDNGSPYTDQEISNIKTNLEAVSDKLLDNPQNVYVDMRGGQGVPDEVKKEVSIIDIRRNTVPGMTEDGLGVELWYIENTGRYTRIKDKDGKPYKFLFESLASETNVEIPSSLPIGAP